MALTDQLLEENPALANVLAQQAPVALDSPGDDPVVLSPGSDLLATPDALVAPPGAPAALPDGSWAPAPAAAPSPEPPPAAAPTSPPSGAPRPPGPSAVESEYLRAAQAEADAATSAAAAQRATADRQAADEANRAIDLRLEAQAKEDEVNRLRAQYDEEAQRTIDSSGAYASRFGEGPIGAVSVILQGLAAGMYGQGSAWKADVERSVDRWVAEEGRKRDAQLKSIDSKLGVAQAGQTMLEERAYDSVERAWAARAAGLALDENKAAQASQIQAVLASKRADIAAKREARLATEAQARYQRQKDARDFALRARQADQELGIKVADLEAKRAAALSEADQRVLSAKFGTTTVGDAAASFRANDQLVKTAGQFDWSSQPGQWSDKQMSAASALVGGRVNVSDERQLKAGLVDLRKQQFAATGGVLSPAEAEKLEGLPLPQLMAEIQAGHRAHGQKLNEALSVQGASPEIRQRATGGLDYTVSARRPK